MTTDDVVTQWWIDGAWTDTYSGNDLAARVRKNPGVEIGRGVSDAQSQFTPASSSFEVNNRDGLFSNRYPGSPLFGKIGRYTKVRHMVKDAGGQLDSYVRFFQPYSSISLLSTTDKAGVEITGDIDIRFEFTPDTWNMVGGYAICGKYLTTGNNRAWFVFLQPPGYFSLRWSTDGTALSQASFSQWPSTSDELGRQIVRITLDVNNGGGGYTATLYRGTGNITSGPWTQLQQIVTAAGTTSIYGLGTAALELGSVSGGSPISGHTNLYGKMHHFQLYNGIAGTLVAEMNPKGKDVADTSWSDGLGNTWTVVNPSARVGSDRIRHTGEMDRMDIRRDTSGQDNWVPMKTLGPLARMQDAGQPIRSPIYRNLISYPLLYGYWTFEEESGATTSLNQAAHSGTCVLTNCSFSGSTPTGLPGSSGAITMNGTDSIIKLGAAGRDNTGGENTFLWFFKLNGSTPASDKPFLTLQGNGTVKRWLLNIGPAGFRLQGYTSSGLGPDDPVNFGTGANPSQGWIGMQLTLSQSGANVLYTWRWYNVLTGVAYVYPVGGSYAGTTGLIGRPTFAADGESAFSGAQVAHAVLSRDVFSLNTSTFRDAANAYVGERAGTRAVRLAGEEGIDLEMRGDPASTQQMGYQTASTPYFLLEECAKVDGGILGDVRDRFAIFMRTRIEMENGDWNGGEVSYGISHELSSIPAPVEDGAFTRNDMTITRIGGGTGRATQTEGPLSTAEPPDGIGFRPGSDSMNAYSDDQIQGLTEREVFVRTRDELRIPSLPFEMHRTAIETDNPILAERLRAMDLGDWIRLVSLPNIWDPDPRRMVTLGYSERFDGQLWQLYLNVITSKGYETPQVNFHDLADDLTTTVKTTITSSGTSIVFVTPSTSRPWIYTAHPDWPGTVSAKVGGEVVTITAMTTPSIVGANWEQTATVTRGVNTSGTGYAWTAGTRIEYYQPNYVGMGV